MRAHTPAEWGEALGAGVAVWLACVVAPAELADPAKAAALDARAAVRAAAQDAALSLAALHMILTPNPTPEATDDRAVRRMPDPDPCRTDLLLDPLPQCGRPTRPGGLMLPCCDCGTCCEACGHYDGCIRYEAHGLDVADEVAAEDGYRPLTVQAGAA